MVWFLEKEEGERDGRRRRRKGREGPTRGRYEGERGAKGTAIWWEKNESGLCEKWRRRWGSKRVEDLAGFEGTGRQLLQHRIKMKFSDGLLHWLMALPDGSHQRDQAQRCVCPSVYVLVYFCLCVFLWLHICIKKSYFQESTLLETRPPHRPPTPFMFVHGSPHWLCGCLLPCASHHLPSLFQNFGSIHIR